MSFDLFVRNGRFKLKNKQTNNVFWTVWCHFVRIVIIDQYRKPLNKQKQPNRFSFRLFFTATNLFASINRLDGRASGIFKAFRFEFDCESSSSQPSNRLCAWLHFIFASWPRRLISSLATSTHHRHRSINLPWICICIQKTININPNRNTDYTTWNDAICSMHRNHLKFN